MTAEPDIESSPIFFAEKILKMNLYWWQDVALTWYEDCIGKRVQGSLCTPNGAGKDSIVIASLALWFVFIHKRGRVIITTRDGKQIDEQTQPAIHRHRDKFKGWEFNEWLVKTPTGGRIRMYATNDPGRVEGAHRDTLDDGTPDPDGPLLIIANEAKSLPDDILDAFDRCTFDGLLYASSSGNKQGRFYESQIKPELGFKKLRVTLKDCPHKTQEQIDSIIAKHGIDSPFVRSTLFGEFMDADNEQRFDREGLRHLADMAEAGHARAAVGSLEVRSSGKALFVKDDTGWLWLDEGPMHGGEYLIFCDPNTCEQGEGTSDRDNTACGVMRAGYIDDQGATHPDHIVAALQWPGGVKWDSDVLAQRMKLLSDFYGGCTAVVEANNFGSALLAKLQALGVPLWRRTKIDDVNPNKQVRLMGFLTTERSREHWVQACGSAVREKALRCRFKPACDEFQTFIFLPSGRAEAQSGCHDDWCAGIGIGLLVRCFTKLPIPQPQRSFSASMTSQQTVTAAASRFGACG